MRKLLMLWVLTGVNLFSAGLLAEGVRWYRIELIVFAQDAVNTEIFDQTEERIDWPNSFSDVANFKQGGKSLNRAYTRLTNAANYHPVMHLSWVQGIKKNSMGKAVHIHKESQYGDYLINGFVRVQRGAYLHLWVDLEYSPEAIKFRLNEKRRFKLNETHYLDHPKFGVIARVSPIN